MKKSICLFIALILLFSICACETEEEPSNKATTNQISSQSTKSAETIKEEFINKIQGYWAQKQDSFCLIMHIEGDLLKSGFYASDSFPDEYITNVKQLEHNKYEVQTHQPETYGYDGSLIPETKHTYIYSSNNDFKKTLIINDKIEYTFAGKTYDSLQKTCDEMLGFGDKFKNEETNDAIQLVLNRKIFIHKEDSPFIYTNTINDIESAKAYHYNWVFGQILNDENFSNIKWNQERTNSGNIVTFNAICKSNSSSINVNFLVPDETKIPIIISLKADNTVIDVNSYYNHMSDAEAILAADASASIMIVLLSVTGA